jgi:hypothetical protein
MGKNCAQQREAADILVVWLFGVWCLVFGVWCLVVWHFLCFMLGV